MLSMQRSASALCPPRMILVRQVGRAARRRAQGRELFAHQVYTMLPGLPFRHRP